MQLTINGDATGGQLAKAIVDDILAAKIGDIDTWRAISALKVKGLAVCKAEQPAALQKRNSW